MGIAASQFYPQINLNPQYTNTLEFIRNYVNPKDKKLAALSKGVEPGFRTKSYFIIYL